MSITSSRCFLQHLVLRCSFTGYLYSDTTGSIPFSEPAWWAIQGPCARRQRDIHLWCANSQRGPQGHHILSEQGLSSTTKVSHVKWNSEHCCDNTATMSIGVRNTIALLKIRFCSPEDKNPYAVHVNHRRSVPRGVLQAAQPSRAQTGPAGGRASYWPGARDPWTVTWAPM